jgi:23S rRNA (guanosine2251-2'-O)-methyltransferase
MNRIIGVHAVQALLDAGRPLDRVLIAKGATSQRLQKIIEDCRTRAVSVRFEPRENLDRLADKGVHQGVVAYAAKKSAARLEDLIEQAEPDGVILVADSVQDPHNLGAIVRTAHAAGAVGVIVPERRAAGLTDTVAKAAAGALEYLPVVKVTNINRTLDELKEAGFWIYGFDERGDRAPWEADFQGKTVIVVGAEGSGLHRMTAEKCDFLLRIPMQGEISSLNVSVAAGIALFEVVRQRHAQQDDESE